MVGACQRGDVVCDCDVIYFRDKHGTVAAVSLGGRFVRRPWERAFFISFYFFTLAGTVILRMTSAPRFGGFSGMCGHADMHANTTASQLLETTSNPNQSLGSNLSAVQGRTTRHTERGTARPGSGRTKRVYSGPMRATGSPECSPRHRLNGAHSDCLDPPDVKGASEVRDKGTTLDSTCGSWRPFSFSKTSKRVCLLCLFLKHSHTTSQKFYAVT
ncbi:LOW QUALITY PROTEIN: uncharacterized protein ACB057_013136 [Neosynchiropus ocellatus]